MRHDIGPRDTWARNRAIRFHPLLERRRVAAPIRVVSLSEPAEGGLDVGFGGPPGHSQHVVGAHGVVPGGSDAAVGTVSTSSMKTHTGRSTKVPTAARTPSPTSGSGRSRLATT